MMRLLAKVRRYKTLYNSTKGTSPAERAKIVRHYLKLALRKRTKRTFRRCQTGHVTLAFRLLPTARALEFFWHSPTVSRSWYDIEARMTWLSHRKADQVERFVQRGLRKNRNALILVNLARHPLSSTWVKKHLTSEVPLLEEETDDRFTLSQSFSGAYVGVLMLIAGPNQAKAADEILKKLHPLPRTNYSNFLDSVATRIRAHGAERSFSSGFLEKKQHRLLIVESAKAYASYLPLLGGAERVTLFDLGDMYANTDLSYFDDKDVPPITMEHLRTRINRFSREYHEAHEDSKEAAKQLASSVFDRFPRDSKLLSPEVKPHFELDIADQIFFELLKVRALRKLLSDHEFDHIVIALNTAKIGSPNYRTLACTEALQSNDKVEFTSIASNFGQRLATQACVTMCTSEPRTLRFDRPLVPQREVFDDLEQKCGRYVEKMDSSAVERFAPAVILANHHPANNTSTAAFIHALSSQFDLKTLFYGGSLRHFLAEDPDRSDILEGTDPTTLSWGIIGDLSDLRRWCLLGLSEATEKLSDELAKLCMFFLGRINQNAVYPSITLFFLTHIWCAKHAELNTLPKLAVVASQRSVKLGLMAEAMRPFDIPSLALEPHGLNGNYCRYSKVMMDHYAVISKYFAETAPADFGIPIDRCHVVGTPRIVAPNDYSPSMAKDTARRTLADEQQLDFSQNQTGAFFCQPSDWAHVEEVWKITLLACKAARSALLLKPHPEESPARIEKYMSVAADLGMRDRVQLVSGQPSLVIEASDFVLTGYSAAALDAAVLGKPVFCVTANGKPYPVNQHKIANAPLCGNVDELKSAIVELTNDPAIAAKRSSEFLSNERQFLEGPDDNLRKLVEELIDMKPSDCFRPREERPTSLFLSGPFQEYAV